jgi:DNA polymerase-3 subunit delta'
LRAALLSGHLPHAFLFTGIDGIGKKTAAMAFAMACNCTNRRAEAVELTPADCMDAGAGLGACGTCPSCKKIRSGNHPDLITISASGPIIKVEQIRALCGRLTLKPYEARNRFAIISDAQKMNAEAGNTLLKTLEDPPASTVFVLTAPQASDILSTIVSRCQQIRFQPLSPASLQAEVQKKYGLDADSAEAIAAMAGGSMTRAHAMAGANWLDRRNWIIRELNALPGQPVNLSLAFSETLAKNKQWLETAFEIMKNWLRDCIVCQFAPRWIIHRDLSDQLINTTQKTGIPDLLQKIRAIEKAETAILSNANPRLTLDALVLALSKGS